LPPKVDLIVSSLADRTKDPNPDEPPSAKKDLTPSRQVARTQSFYNFLASLNLGVFAFNFLACL
jgi:hypothetical protein